MPQNPAILVKDEGGEVDERHEFITPIQGLIEGDQRFPLSSPDNNDCPRDRAWAIAFKINVVITVISALWFGGTGIKALSPLDILHGRRLSEDASGGGGLLPAFFLCVALIALPWALSWGLLIVLINCSTKILQAAFLGSSGLFLVGTIIALVTGQVTVAIIFGAAFILSIIFCFPRWGRIQFGGENLKVAALAIKSMPWTVHSAVLISAFQVLWSAVTSVAASGTMVALETVRAPGGTDVYRAVDCHNEFFQDAASPSCVCRGEIISDNSPCSYNGPSTILTLFWTATLIWSSEVIRNVLAATVTGSVASWWYTPNDPTPVQGAFYRATGPSFGSLCKASAITGTPRLLRWITRRFSLLKRFVDLLLACVQVTVDYAVAYTVCFIGIYGLSFSEAGSRAGELFLSCGVTTIANDTLVDMGFSLLAAAFTVVYVGVILLLAASAYASHLASSGIVGLVVMIFCFIYSLVVCMILISTTLEVLRSGFKAVFVCFIQDPDVLATNHDQQLHADLSEAWQKIQLQEFRLEARSSPTMEVELA